jgi:hypothetical protein
MAVLFWAQSNPVPRFDETVANETGVDQAAPVASLTSASPAKAKAQSRILDQYGKLPLSFEANTGQADGQVRFLSRTGGYTLFLTQDEAVLALSGTKTDHNSTITATARRSESGMAESMNGAVLRMKFRHAHPPLNITGLDRLGSTSNYFIGNQPAQWHSNVPNYAKVKYEGIYSGIDLVFYGNQRQLEYDFIVAPGADPRRIAFDVGGAKRIREEGNGDLVFVLDGNEIRWHRPLVYQENVDQQKDDRQKHGAKQFVAASYTITDRNVVGFKIADYDASRPLYIDPLIYSTYLGGSGNDYGYGIAVDGAGNAYVTGQTFSTDFPITKGALETACGNGGKGCTKYGEAFVAKLNAAGSALVYSTYLGGTGNDYGSSIAVDSAGDAYVTGQTYSPNFPTTPGAFQRVCQHPCDAHGNAFVTKLNPAGSALVYSTYLGGSGADWGGGIAVDSTGNAYVTGQTYSANFPSTPGAVQTVCGDPGCTQGDAFATKFNPTGTALVYSSYLGGSGMDYGRSVAADSAGNAYVIGGTLSPDFPITPGAVQTVCGDPGCTLGDAFVTKLNPTGSALVYSSYLGGNDYDIGTSIAADSAGNAYVIGWTGSTDFPTKNPIQAYYAGGGDAFVAKLNASGTALTYSTYLGGSGEDNGNGIAVDSAGNVYVTGGTTSTDFPTMNPLQDVNKGYDNVFVATLNASGSALTTSTYIGGSNYDSGTGIATDGAGNTYVVGATDSTNFPTEKPLQAANHGAFDVFVAKIGAETPTTTTLSSSPNPSTYGQSVTFTAAVTSGNGAPPNGETVTFMKGKTVLGTGALSGGSASFITTKLPTGTSSITAVYGGDSNFAGSTSKPVKQVVER